MNNEFKIMGARLCFRNFSGKESKFNPKGNRNFCILLSNEDADELIRNGWNVKVLPPRNAMEDPIPYIKVSVKYDFMPPKVVLISNNEKIVVEQDKLSSLDLIDIEFADIVIRGYDWEVNGVKGKKAYLKMIYITESNKYVRIENARLCFRNFSGKESKFNPAGNRNFCVLLSNEDADELSSNGWNVKVLPPRDATEDPQPYIKVSIRYDFMPPNVKLVSSNGEFNIGEDEIYKLDWIETERVDLEIRGYDWEVNGVKGKKAYLRSICAVLYEDEIDKKYSGVSGYDIY